MKFGAVKYHEHIYKFYLYRYFIEAFKYGDAAKFSGYVGTKAELLCVRFCGLVQSYVLANYLTVCVFPLNNFRANWFIIITAM
jgi:hypothetical protein